MSDKGEKRKTFLSYIQGTGGEVFIAPDIILLFEFDTRPERPGKQAEYVKGSPTHVFRLSPLHISCPSFQNETTL